MQMTEHRQKKENHAEFVNVQDVFAQARSGELASVFPVHTASHLNLIPISHQRSQERCGGILPRGFLPSEPWAACELACTSRLKPDVFFLRLGQMMARSPQALSAASGTQTSSTDTCSDT